jgi:hypothetical protein
VLPPELAVLYNAPYEQQGETADVAHRQGTGAATRPTNKFKTTALAVVAANRMKAVVHVAEDVGGNVKKENVAGRNEEGAADIEQSELISPPPPTSRSYRNLVATLDPRDSRCPAQPLAEPLELLDTAQGPVVGQKSSRLQDVMRDGVHDAPAWCGRHGQPVWKCSTSCKLYQRIHGEGGSKQKALENNRRHKP